MTETKKTVEADATRDTVHETASEETLEEETSTETTEDKSTSKEDETDYDELDRKEQERVGKPDPVKAVEAFKKREDKRHRNSEEEVDETDVDDDKPITRRELTEIISGVQKTTQESQAYTIARANTSSEAEARAAITFWKTRVKPTGNLQEDVMFAIGGLNYKKVVSKNNELGRALKSKETASKDSAGAYRDPNEGSAPKIDSQTKNSLERAGFKFDVKDKLYKKQLPNGSYLIKDLRTKRTYTAPAPKK